MGTPGQERDGLQLLEELSRRFAAGEIEAAFALYHPDLRIEQPASLPHGGVHRGHGGVRAMGALFAQHWARTIEDPRRMACDGGALQLTTQTWVARATGRSATVDVLELFAFRAGLVSEIRVFQQDTQRLLATLEGAPRVATRPWARSADLRVVDPDTVERLARHFEEGWNAEDADTIVAPFADDVRFSSPFVPSIGRDPAPSPAHPSGQRRAQNGATIEGLAAVRRYVTEALTRAPGIRYTLDRVHAGTDTLALCYTVFHPRLGKRSGVDSMRVGADGRVVEWRCHYPFEREGGRG